MNRVYRLYTGAALIGAALFAIRLIAPGFRLGTTTADHPYLLFTGLLIVANLVWLFLIPLLKSIAASGGLGRSLWALLGLGILFRALFFGTVPIYEDDWNRYLLNILSGEHDHVARKINNSHLTTIYPPVAQGAFVLAALIKPVNQDALRFVYLLCEALTLFLLVKALPLYGRSPVWAVLYALSPLLIYSGFNVMHMDILLPPFILLVMIAIKKRPYWAGAALAGAAAIKVWPLVLAPIFYRPYLKRPMIYISAALFIAVLSAILFYPMLRHLGDGSGLQAYSGGWERSSFLFPRLKAGLSFIADDPARIARIIVAITVTGLSFWYGFFSKNKDENALPFKLMMVTMLLLFLSPTGFPWYAIWIIIFIPFVPLYSAALLCALVPLYYVRFALGEQQIYHVYKQVLVPLQFGLPLLVLAFELRRRRAHV